MRLTQSVVSLVLLGLAIAPCADAETLTCESRKELLQKAEHWLVPQPNPDSRLLKIGVYQSDIDFYVLGFVEPANPDRALVGFDYWDITRRTETKDVPQPDNLSLADIAPTSPFARSAGRQLRTSHRYPVGPARK